MSDIDTRIEEILDVLIMGYCPELIGDINKSFQYYTEAHKAIKTLLIQSKIEELENLMITRPHHKDSTIQVADYEAIVEKINNRYREIKSTTKEKL